MTARRFEHFRCYRDLSSGKPEPTPYVVDRLVPQGSLTLFVGDSESFKTWFVSKLAICVSAGKPFGDRDCKDMPVLLLDLENTDRMLRKRLSQLRGSEEPNDNLFFQGRDEVVDLGDDECVGDLIWGMNRKGIGLLIVDPCRECHNLNEDSNTEIMTLLKALKRIRHECEDCTIVVVHHTGWHDDGNPRGASAFFNAFDESFSFKKDKDVDGQVNVKHRKPRFDKRQPSFAFCVTFNEDESEAHIEFLALKESKKTDSKKRTYQLDITKEWVLDSVRAGVTSNKELLALIESGKAPKSVSKARLNRAIRKLKDDEEIDSDGRRYYLVSD